MDAGVGDAGAGAGCTGAGVGDVGAGAGIGDAGVGGADLCLSTTSASMIGIMAYPPPRVNMPILKKVAMSS